MKDYELTFAMMAALDASRLTDRPLETSQTGKSAEQVMREGKQLLAELKEEERLRQDELRILGLLRDAYESPIDCKYRLQDDLNAKLYRADELFACRDKKQTLEWKSQAISVFEELVPSLKNARLFNQGQVSTSAIIVK